MFFTLKEVGSNSQLRINVDRIAYYMPSPTAPAQTIIVFNDQTTAKAAISPEELDKKLGLISIEVRDVNGHIVRSV